MQPSFSDLAELPPEETLPYLDHAKVDETALSPAQLEWRRDGVMILPGFLPDHLIDAYSAQRAALGQPGGWASPVSYLHVPQMRKLALYPPLMCQMQELIGEPMLLHLCLTGWVSTERGWHQDDYLNPSFVNGWYAAVWMALDDIHPDSGPFEYVPGSHCWPLMRGEKIRAHMPWNEAAKPNWPSLADSFVLPAIEREIERQGAGIKSFIAKRGDVLIWHGRLLHRGSKPRSPGMMRKSLITHYSGVTHRLDMPRRASDENGQLYALVRPAGPIKRGLRTLVDRMTASFA